MKFEIVSPHEMNLEAGKISLKSPIGAALMGKKVGDIAEAQVPSGTLRLRILPVHICIAWPLGVIFHFTFLSDRSLGPTLFPNSIFLSVNVIQNFTHSDPVSGLVRRSKEHIRNHSVCHICVYFLRIGANCDNHKDCHYCSQNDEQIIGDSIRR